MADLIDRQQAREHCLEFFPECSNVVDLVIDKEPTVDAVPVAHAQWEPQAENDGVVFGYQCSRCAALWYFPDGGTPREHNARYCPECGARMDGRADNG